MSALRDRAGRTDKSPSGWLAIFTEGIDSGAATR
jgi:hypothetical protein